MWITKLFVFFAITFYFVATIPTIDEANKKLNAKIDIVLIVNLEHPDPNHDERQHMKRAFAESTTYFEMAPDKVRFALVTGLSTNDSQIEPIVSNLTSDRQEINESLINWMPPGLEPKFHTIDFVKAFKAVGDIFEKSGDRFKVIVAKAWPATMEKDVQTAWEQALYHVEFLFFVSPTNDTTGRQYPMVALKHVIRREMCAWKSGCVYADKNQSQCQGQVWQSPVPTYFDDGNEQCDEIKIPKPIDCIPENCIDLCARSWPLDGPMPVCGNDSCGKSIMVKRKPSDKAPLKMENCTREIFCPECATTSTPPEDESYPWWIVAVVIVVFVVVMLIAAVGYYNFEQHRAIAEKKKKPPMPPTTSTMGKTVKK